MNAALPWQDHLYIILSAFAVTGIIARIIWIKIGTLEDVPRPGIGAQGEPATRPAVNPPGPGHSTMWAKPAVWDEPTEEDTLTWLARIHDEPDRLDDLAAAFVADTLVDARIRDWLDELIEQGLGGYRTADEWVAARTRELAAVTA